MAQREFVGLAAGQRFEDIGKSGGRRHFGAIDQQRKDPQAGPAEGFDDWV